MVAEALLSGTWFSCCLGIHSLHPRFVQRPATNISGNEQHTELKNICILCCNAIGSYHILSCLPLILVGCSVAVICLLHIGGDEIFPESQNLILWYSWTSLVFTHFYSELPFQILCICVGLKYSFIFQTVLFFVSKLGRVLFRFSVQWEDFIISYFLLLSFWQRL